jgi:hypothetical protein
VVGSSSIRGLLVSMERFPGSVQVRIRRRLRTGAVLLPAAMTGVLSLIDPMLAPVPLLLAAADVGRGMWRTGPRLRRALLGMQRDP